MSGTEPGATSRHLELLSSCTIGTREKLSHLAVAEGGVTKEGGIQERLVSYSKLMGVNSLDDSVVAGIVMEFDLTLVGILVAKEMHSHIVSAVQSRHLERISGKSGQNIWTQDLLGVRRLNRGSKVALLRKFENDLFANMKVLNREISGVSYYPSDSQFERAKADRDYVSELGIKPGIIF